MVNRRILLNEIFTLIQRLIKECDLKSNDYYFYNFKLMILNIKEQNIFKK